MHRCSETLSMERVGRARVVCALGVLMILIASGQALAAGTFYVDNSTSCSDGGPGSAATPYCTISKAVDVRGGPGTTILVRPGIYREEVEIRASGSSSNPFVVQASGSPVTIDGADSLESPSFWTRCSGSSNVYSTTRVTWTPLQVFADGARLTASTSSACSIPINTYRYVSGSGLY